MSEPLIIVDRVSKKFCKDLKKGLWYGLQDLGSGVMRRKGEKALRPEEFWAVNDISFEVRRGECMGLVGHNGAGKSTLLKMLNGLLNPDKGSIEMRGRVGALIELGAGFNPILTGRENIFNNAAVLGFTKKETEKKLDAIIEFSEIADFIDSPVQYYSSGMKVRLGFAVAAQMEPDIMLIDEVLAVGDMGFILKCFNKMDQLLGNTAMILVSHSMPQIGRMCTNLLLMNHGESNYCSNDVSTGITKYYEMFKEEIGNFKGSGKAELESIKLSVNGVGPKEGAPFTIEYGDDLEIEIVVKCLEKINFPGLYLAFYDKEQRNFAEVDNFTDQLIIEEIEGLQTFKTKIPNIQFAQGKYSITVGFLAGSLTSRETLFRFQSAVYFNVNSKQHGWAPIQLNPQWAKSTL